MATRVIPVDDLQGPNPPTWSGSNWQMLAEGDSWFSIGTAKLFQSSSVLRGLDLSKDTAILNCAAPGDTLRRMVEFHQNQRFVRQLNNPQHGQVWTALLLSGGGNDMIDAAQVPRFGDDGTVYARHERLLLTPEEVVDDGSDIGLPGSHISEPGWLTLQTYLQESFKALLNLRSQGQNADTPIICHTYATPTARKAGTLGRRSAWLYKAFENLGTPAAVRQAICNELYKRLRDLLLGFDQNSGTADALPKVHVFDSAALNSIVPADPTSTGSSNDWINEIHLTDQGYRKLGEPFSRFIEQVLQG